MKTIYKNDDIFYFCANKVDIQILMVTFKREKELQAMFFILVVACFSCHKKQQVTTFSIAKVKYIIDKSCVAQVVWLRSILYELQYYENKMKKLFVTINLLLY